MRSLFAYGDNIMSYSDIQQHFGITLKWCPFCNYAWPGLWMGPNPHVTCGRCGTDGPIMPFNIRAPLYERQMYALTRWNIQSTV